MKLNFRPIFLTDIEDCADYLATEAGEAVVLEWQAALKSALAVIEQTPEIGRVRRDLPQPEIRTLNLRKYPKYLVFYRLENGEIELLRCRHGMMNLPELF